MKVFVNYKERHEGGGEICAGEENDDWPSHETSYYSFETTDVTLVNTTPYHENLEIDLPEPMPMGLWTVVARYSDGDTFGSSSGHGSIEGVFLTEEEAKTRAKEIKDGGKSIRGYSPWTGYFSDLEGVDINLVPLRK